MFADSREEGSSCNWRSRNLHGNPFTDRLYITEIHETLKVILSFPRLMKNEWMKFLKPRQHRWKNRFAHDFIILQKIVLIRLWGNDHNRIFFWYGTTKRKNF